MKTIRRELELLESRETPATFTWTGLGADDNWSTADNWQGNSGPAQAAGGTALDLVFPSSASRLSNLNDLTDGAVVNSIAIQGSGYTLGEAAGGHAIVLGTGSTGDFTVSGGIASAVFSIPTTLNTTGTPVVDVGTGSVLTISGPLASNGGATLLKTGTGTLVLSGDNAGYNGKIILGSNAGILLGQGNLNAFGSTANDTFVGTGSQVQIDSLSGAIFEPFHISGTGISGDGALVNLAGDNLTHGTVFLDVDASIGVAAGKLTLNGFLVAAGNSSFTKVGPGTLQLNQTETLFGPTTIAAGTLTVNGNIQFSAVTLAGGTLAGFGRTGALTATGGTLRPGLNLTPVNFTTGAVSMSGATYSPQFSHTTGDISDLLNVLGGVNLTGGTLAPITTGFTPSRTESLLLIENDGTDPIVGTFNGLPEGATVNVAGVAFKITYQGNTGNDVLLTPSTPIPDNDPFAVGGYPNGFVVSYPPANAGKYQTLPSVSAQPFGAITGNVRVASADVDGDSIKDIIAITGPGTNLRLAVLSGVDSSVLVAPFDPLGGNFTGGGFVSAADFDGDDKAEVVVTPDRGGGPRVVIFSFNAGQPQQRASFLGIDDDAFRGGARSAAGDIDNDDVPELAISAGFLGGPRIAVFEGGTVFGTPTRLVPDFFAFETALRNGAYVAIGDVDGDGFGDMLFGAGPGGAPRLLTISGKTLVQSDSGAALADPISNFFVAGNVADRGGVRVAVNDTDTDSKADVITATGEMSPSRVRVYLGTNFGGGEPGTFQELDPFQSLVLADGTFVG